MKAKTRYLGIDPGEKNVGLAISDQSGTISRPLKTIKHTSYKDSAAIIQTICDEHDIGVIVLGISLDESGEATFSGRKAIRLADSLKNITDIPLEFWDEQDSTQKAQESRRLMGVSRKKRKGHLDEVAACIILQSYLDAHIDQKREHAE